MTTEEKAKAYDEALEKAKEINNEHKAQPFDVMLKVFPELKEESEDERISKEIIKYLERSVPHHHYDEVLKSKEWIVWLEKRGWQKPANNVEPKFKVGDYIINSQGTLRHIINVDKAAYQREIDWLKSLKERYIWNPSDYQLEALDSATENCAYSEYQDCLRELIEQLKKLKK